MAQESLYAAAMAHADRKPDLDEHLFYMGDDGLHLGALAVLQRAGVRLIGDPTLVAWALDAAKRDFIAGLEELFRYEPPKRSGRPPNGIVHNLILVAAFHRFFAQNEGYTQARRSAAKWLGKPITSDKVEKAYKAFLSQAAVLYGRLPPEERAEKTAGLILNWQRMLDEAETELRSHGETKRQRRFYAADGTCFRASPATKLESPQQ